MLGAGQESCLQVAGMGGAPRLQDPLPACGHGTRDSGLEGCVSLAAQAFPPRPLPPPEGKCGYNPLGSWPALAGGGRGHK